MNYKFPGVYVEEISTLPPSVAGVATAIPAFIGYTEKALDRKGNSLPDEVIVQRIDTFLEYKQYFGENPKFVKFTAESVEGNLVLKRKNEAGDADAGLLHTHLMYYALQMYFSNGGGACYIVSVARYEATAATVEAIDKGKMKEGLDKLAEYDEPTLILMPDAIGLVDSTVDISTDPDPTVDYHTLCGQVLTQCNDLKDRFGIFDVLNADADAAKFRSGVGNNFLNYGAAYTPYLKTVLTYRYKEEDIDVSAVSGEANANLASIKKTHTGLYNQIKTALAQQRVVLPPSSAMAGIYASVDRNRGVWKAPANVSVASTIEPIQKITNVQQGNLNIDPTTGKSINAIRAFTGKGNLVWGARTLAGNDNEWRYINVRRLFIYMEESIQKATAFAVFEPNTATTWLKVKGMIESFLYGLWQQGALAGPTAESAYYINVGLGKTMTPQDILEGKMIVEIGVAAVRPAEFIILRFMHKLQEA